MTKLDPPPLFDPEIYDPAIVAEQEYVRKQIEGIQVHLGELMVQQMLSYDTARYWRRTILRGIGMVCLTAIVCCWLLS